MSEDAGPLMLATVLLGGVDDARQALGYNVGIELLRRAVEDLGQVVPADTLIARVEADELVIARRLSRTTGPGVPGPGVPGPGVPGPGVRGPVPEEVLLAGQALAADLAQSIAAGRYLVDGIEVLLRAHIGLVFAPWDGVEVAELVRRASLNARRAAHDGVTTALWDGDRDAMTGEDLALLADLRLAVEHDELWLAYQPQVVASGGTVVSVEALLRWDSPVHGSIPPGRFIILAERTGLIDRLTEWVLHQALDAQVRWRAKGVDLPVSVNLSAKTLGRPDLAAWILAQLDVRQLPTFSLRSTCSHPCMTAGCASRSTTLAPVIPRWLPSPTCRSTRSKSICNLSKERPHLRRTKPLCVVSTSSPTGSASSPWLRASRTSW